MTKVDRLDDEILIGHPENLFDSGVVDAGKLIGVVLVVGLFLLDY